MNRMSAVQTLPLVNRRRGLSIVEFMVGIAVGLFIVGGATKLFVDYLGSNRTLLLETRVNQDLRAAADLVVRDLRRASYWRNATAALNPATPAASNPYATVAYNAASATLTYSYSKDNVDTVDAATEEFGVRRGVVSGKGVVQLQTAGAWQTITDPGTLDIPSGVNGLRITPTAAYVVPLWDQCPCIFEGTCFPRQFENPDPVTTLKGIHFDDRKRITIRQYELRIRAQSSTDAKIVREIRELVRVRNDQLDGTCPT